MHWLLQASRICLLTRSGEVPRLSPAWFIFTSVLTSCRGRDRTPPHPQGSGDERFHLLSTSQRVIIKSPLSCCSPAHFGEWMLCNRTENHLRDGVGDSLQKWGNRNAGRRGSGVVRAGTRALVRFWSAQQPWGVSCPLPACFLVGNAVAGELRGFLSKS